MANRLSRVQSLVASSPLITNESSRMSLMPLSIGVAFVFFPSMSYHPMKLPVLFARKGTIILFLSGFWLVRYPV